jgi:hypothetical protein
MKLVNVYMLFKSNNALHTSSWDPKEPFMADATQRILSIHTLRDQYLLAIKEIF